MKIKAGDVLKWILMIALAIADIVITVGLDFLAALIHILIL